MRGFSKAPEEAGSEGPQGLPARGRMLTAAIRWISETFGSYKARAVRAVCLRNYSDFLLSETALTREGLRGASRRRDRTHPEPAPPGHWSDIGPKPNQSDPDIRPVI